jgi:glycosyltransferase involved in cell wall biosynthesis
MAAGAPPILFVEASPFLGGAARSLLDLVGALPGGACRPVLAAACAEVAAAGRGAGLDTHIVSCPPPSRSLAPWRSLPALARLLAAREALWRLATGERVRLVHANSTWAHLIAGDLLGLPSIWHCRDLTRLSVLAGRLVDTASCAVAASHAVAGHLSAQGVPPEMIRVIPNGVAVRGVPGAAERPAVRAALRAEWRIPGEAPVLAWAGELAPWKRTEDFLLALAELQKSLPGVRGLVLGAGLAEGHRGREAELAGLANRLGIGAAVRFAGWRPDVPRCLAAADLLVLTSANEPFGRVLVEAMAAGVPVVARNGGGVAEVLGAEAGLILEAPGPADFAAAAARLLADPAERARMAEAGSRRARELFSPELAAERFGRLWAELLG